jgi:hypothetical protein
LITFVQPGNTTMGADMSTEAMVISGETPDDAKCKMCGGSLGKYHVVIGESKTPEPPGRQNVACNVTEIKNDLFGVITIHYNKER